MPEADSGDGCDRPGVVVDDEAHALDMALAHTSASKVRIPKQRVIWRTFYGVDATAQECALPNGAVGELQLQQAEADFEPLPFDAQ